MRLGLVSDIHNHDTHLCGALRMFRSRQVDQVLTMGDTCDAFAPTDGADRVVALLAAANAIGVWGNHDFPLSQVDVECENARHAPATRQFMQAMRPGLEVDGYYFSHRDASVNPHDVEELWTYEDEEGDLISRAMAALSVRSNRCQLIGHYHRWWATTSAGPLDWNGTTELVLHPAARYFVVIAAVAQGWCAVLDTSRGTLLPLRIDA